MPGIIMERVEEGGKTQMEVVAMFTTQMMII